MTDHRPIAERDVLKTAERRRSLSDAMHAMHADQRIIINLALAERLEQAWDAYDKALTAELTADLATAQAGFEEYQAHAAEATRAWIKALDDLAIAQAEVGELRATLERERKTEMWVTDAWIPKQQEDRLLAEIASLQAALVTATAERDIARTVVEAARRVTDVAPCPLPHMSFGHENHGADGCEVYRHLMLRHAVFALDAAPEGAR